MRVQDAAKQALWELTGEGGGGAGGSDREYSEPPLPPQHQPLPSSSLRPGPTTSPAKQACGPGTKAVHDDPQRQGGGAEHEGADGEAQVEHLFLIVTGGPPELCIFSGVSGVLG